MKFTMIASVFALSASAALAGDDNVHLSRWDPDPQVLNSTGNAAKIWTVDDDDDDRGNQLRFGRGNDDDDDDDDRRRTRLGRGGDDDDDD